MDTNKFLEVRYDQMYIATMKPLLDKKALFSDMTGDYLYIWYAAMRNI